MPSSDVPSTNRPGMLRGDSIVDWVISEFPTTASVFMRRRMHCVGCPMARFESIAEACSIYEQPVQPFLAELTSAASADEH